MGSNEELLAAGHVGFVEDAGQVMAHRYAANGESVGNVLIGQCLSTISISDSISMTSARAFSRATSSSASGMPVAAPMSGCAVAC